MPALRSPSRVRLAAALLLALVLLAGFAVAAFSRQSRVLAGPAPEAGPEASAPEVSVEVVSVGAGGRELRVTGTLRSDETVTLTTQATGVVRRVTVREGDRVRRGQLLVQLDDADLQAQRDRARAAVLAAEAQRENALAQVRVAEVRLQQARTAGGMKTASAESEYRRAEQALAAARTRLSQARSLAGIAATEAESRVASARASLQSARERLKALQGGARRQERAAAEAAVARAQAQVARTRAMLDRREQLLREKAISMETAENARRDYEVAQSDLEAARQQLSLVQEGPRTEEIRVGEQAVRQAEAALRDAEANRARSGISSEDVEAAEAQVRQAEAAVDAAKANLAQREWNDDEVRSAEAALRQARSAVGQAEAAIAQAQADVRYQDERIAETRIVSPVSGVVTKRSVHEGTAVVPMRSELLTLVASDTAYFEATAPETALPQLRAGIPAEVLLDAAPGRVFRGVLRRIIPVAEGADRSVRLRISLPVPERLAVVGGFARATLQTVPAGITVRRSALVSDEGEMAVFRAVNGKAVRSPVRVADPAGSGERALVLSGLRPGDRVIVEGASSLVDGQPVVVKAEE